MNIGEKIFYVVVAFAFGVLVRDVAQDWRDYRVEQVAPDRVINWRPRCPGAWIVKQADRKKPVGKCLKGTRV